MVTFAIAFVYIFNYLDHLGLQKGSSDWIHRHNVNDFFLVENDNMYQVPIMELCFRLDTTVI